MKLIKLVLIIFLLLFSITYADDEMSETTTVEDKIETNNLEENSVETIENDIDDNSEDNKDEIIENVSEDNENSFIENENISEIDEQSLDETDVEIIEEELIENNEFEEDSVITDDYDFEYVPMLTGASTYNIVIPTSMSLDTNYTINYTVNSGYLIHVSLSSLNGNKVKYGSNSIAYTSNSTRWNDLMGSSSFNYKATRSSSAVPTVKGNYTDTLTFNIESRRLIPNFTLIKLNNERTVYVMDYYGNNHYLVMERNSVASRPYYAPTSTCGVNYANSSCDNTYENSELDTWINNTWYNSLSTTIKNNIITTDIFQGFWSHIGNSSTCSAKNGGVRVGEHGDHPFPSDSRYYGQTQTWKGATSNVINRRVFLPSLNELVTMGVNMESYNATRSFLTESGGSTLAYLLTRDGAPTSNKNINALWYSYGGVAGFSCYDSGSIRPAYVIDLTSLSYTILS